MLSRMLNLFIFINYTCYNFSFLLLKIWLIHERHWSMHLLIYLLLSKCVYLEVLERIVTLWPSGGHSSKTLLRTNDFNWKFNLVRVFSKGGFVGYWQSKFIIYFEIFSSVAWSEDRFIHGLAWIYLELVLFNDFTRCLPDEVTRFICICRHTSCGCVNQFFLNLKA